MPDISRLTEKQKECLRLVACNYNTKQIARRIGRSDHTVDQRIRLALQALQVPDRFTAARLLTEAEMQEREGVSSAQDRRDVQPQTYQPLIYQSETLPNAENTQIVSPAEAVTTPSVSHRVPPLGGSSNDLDPLEKIKRISGMAMLMGGSIAALVAAGSWLMTLFH